LASSPYMLIYDEDAWLEEELSSGLADLYLWRPRDWLDEKAFKPLDELPLPLGADHWLEEELLCILPCLSVLTAGGWFSEKAFKPSDLSLLTSRGGGLAERPNEEKLSLRARGPRSPNPRE
jgi:hypothetical protein